MTFFPTIDVNAVEADALARGLYAVAAVDGIHEKELALISEFLRATAGGDEASAGAATPASLARVAPLEPQALASLLPGAALRELFVKAAYLVAWADGSVSAPERSLIGKFAKALDVAPEAQSGLEAQVKDYLLRPLAHLANLDAVTSVARKLGA